MEGGIRRFRIIKRQSKNKTISMKFFRYQHKANKTLFILEIMKLRVKMRGKNSLKNLIKN